MDSAAIESISRHIQTLNQTSLTPFEGIMVHATEPPVEIDVISEYTTVTFILSGEQNMRLGDRSFIARGGDMLFIPFQLPISTRFLPHAHAQFTGVSLVLDEQWLADIAAQTSLRSNR
ncbi:hypothetical protein CRG49_009975 [Neisseria sp. N95_16]|uniref:Uncharacterized protein n=1 Tax=Neisseria brasiliensis TaxID=2666100 RepID=A0A5Q3RY29_9NEIS|nr:MULTISPECIES: AraC family transcriptional regulator N-terminal domain-containing protein [Neisseria]MRN38873.1 hypothetical protein [Neisseria brasiliensis]PJO08981.1 hypothetical protein CRG49_009975 [Neisseria sp. N95_16]PJO78279.1 hypothetical protein CWC45_06050 [Neisseria sp. N177_16]QGL24263.1 hypothetical protein GJV52_01090 [Neisseria brasiliensis]